MPRMYASLVHKRVVIQPPRLRPHEVRARLHPELLMGIAARNTTLCKGLSNRGHRVQFKEIGVRQRAAPERVGRPMARLAAVVDDDDVVLHLWSVECDRVCPAAVSHAQSGRRAPMTCTCADGFLSLGTPSSAAIKEDVKFVPHVDQNTLTRLAGVASSVRRCRFELAMDIASGTSVWSLAPPKQCMPDGAGVTDATAQRTEEAACTGHVRMRVLCARHWQSAGLPQHCGWRAPRLHTHRRLALTCQVVWQIPDASTPCHDLLAQIGHRVQDRTLS